MGTDTQDARKVLKALGISAVSACIAESVTLPLDTAKVRLQLQNRASGGAAGGKLPGPLTTVRNIYTNEGLSALFKGLEAGIHRQIIFTGLRVGLYGSILDLYNKGHTRDEAPLHARVGAAMTTSAVGITLANPSDVVKVRTQASEQPRSLLRAVGHAVSPEPIAVHHGLHKPQPTTAAATAVAHAADAVQAGKTGGAGKGAGGMQAGAAAAGARRTMCTAHGPTADLYKRSAFHVYRHIIKREGVAGGLYSGYTPNVIRNTIISASELVTYDVAKRELRAAAGVPDGPAVHLLAGGAAGLVATALGNPMDVVSTRIMVRKSKGAAAGMAETCREMFVREGPLSFYQGFVPNFARIGAFNVVLWMSLEQITRLLS